MPDASAEFGDWIRSAVDRYERSLIVYAARMLRDPERARDVVQEVFCRLCRQRRQDVEDHLDKWLYTVCRNRALDVLRKEKRMRPMSDAQARGGAVADPGPAREVEQREDTTRMLAAIDELPERQKEIVRLKFQHGMSYRQIGQITGDSISNVGYLLHHALKDLRQRMNVRAVEAQGEFR